MSLEQWKTILAKLLPWADFIKLTGGEPTLYPDFYLLLDALEESSIPFVLLTSGRWRQHQTLLTRLKEASNFKGLLISLHGPNAQTHEAFTASVGSFQEASDAIRAAAELGLEVAASVVMVRPNLGRLEATANRAFELGANQVVFARHIGQHIPGLTLSNEELRAAINEVRMLEGKRLRIKFGNCIPQCFEPSSSVGCSAGQTFCTIDPWGNLRPCNHSRLVGGNLLSQSIEEVWHSDTMWIWRQMISPECSNCQAFTQCRGGCRASAMENAGRDPLMLPNSHFEVPLKSKTQLNLYAYAVPHSRYRVRYESSGPVLIRHGRAISISPSELQMLDRVNGNYTLQQIREELGDQALYLIGGLYKQCFIALQ
jgi:radical SAM protein with 4Fe4S-binding SPASM domain